MIRGAIMIAIALSSILVGCDGPRGQLSDADVTALRMANGVYRLSPGDELKITVFNEPELTGEFQVGDTGRIAFPLIGEVEAAGASVDEFRERLTGRLQAGYMRNPKVSIEVASYRPINVMGEVRNAGQYPYRPGLTVQDAIALAGGPTYRADSRTVYLRRAEAGGEISIQPDHEQVSVLPGDSVRVPERYF